MAKIQSVEPNIADLANGWLKSYKRDYKLEQESLNTEIDQALNDYYSKNGGVGGNRPDAKLLLQDKNLVNYPILIEYKGYKDKLVKLDADGKVANKTAKNQPDFRNINSYAVNGAVHYANALLHYTSYTDSPLHIGNLSFSHKNQIEWSREILCFALVPERGAAERCNIAESLQARKNVCSVPMYL